MPANWSLILNILLLIGVIIAIGRLMKVRRDNLSGERYPKNSNTAKVEPSSYNVPAVHDDIISVRKVEQRQTSIGKADVMARPKQPEAKPSGPRLMPKEEALVVQEVTLTPRKNAVQIPSTVMIFLLGKENRQFAGYELLQTVLSCGLRFGEGNLFHRHQSINGQGPILCSLAAATASGVFDLQNIGAFSAHGLCLFMKTSSVSVTDAERFSVMLETARQLSEGLNAHLLDDQRRPLTSERLAQYYHQLNIECDEFEEATA
jgi:cell division protein ZipA